VRVPLRANARLQLHREFTLDDAARQLPYYSELGISHLYLSPISAAVSGSRHGYDVIEPGQVNPDIGGEPALLRLAEAARARNMGLILDIVPNHMAAHADNPWWWDVMKHGRRSRHARWFDIDWNAPGCRGKLCLPVLDRPYAQALAEGALDVRQCGGDWELHHETQRFPLTGTPPSAGDAQLLHQWLEEQPYRLLWWRAGNELINYRRFFDITSLAALRVERPEVFAAVHALPLRLIADGWVDGLRIDHVDGLADPAAYLRRLRTEVDRATAGDPHRIAPVRLWVEKILAPAEQLPPGWCCDGTTGYDFMDQAGALLHDPGGQQPLSQLWRRSSGRTGNFATEEQQARDEILDGPLQAEFARAMRALQAVAGNAPEYRELGPSILARALAALMRRFPVYRTYAGTNGLDDTDVARVDAAARAVMADAEPRLHAAIAAIANWLCTDGTAGWRMRAQLHRMRRRIEQLSAPLNAKAVEDTAFYRHGVLLSRNEVGSHPEHFALSADDFHAACRQRAETCPHGLLVTATHDHKRGEDVRARLAVISELPDWWIGQVEHFDAMARSLWQEDALEDGDSAEAQSLWQTLVGAWPLGLAGDDQDGIARYSERVAEWQLKAAREAKLRTSWTHPNEGYEQAMARRLKMVMASPQAAPLRQALAIATQKLAPAGAVNGLVQATLRLTVPGVPDLYQGSDGWDLSLVDPDNRGAVDYRQRQAWLAGSQGWPELLTNWQNGAVKARLIATLLQLRQRLPQLFATGDYQPLKATGDAAAHVLAFQREYGGQRLIVAVPLRVADWIGQLPLAESECWRDTVLTIPQASYQRIFEDGADAIAAGPLKLSDLFAGFPVAVLVSS
jgi:(1->4)-alpha-D-glucan 1-alpha-D-glucosylmutase